MKNKKRLPQTLNDRIEDLFIKKNKPVPFTNEDKKILGKQIVDKYFSESNIKKFPVGKVTIVEDGQEIQVVQYPAFFVPVMDAFIWDYLKTKK